jgi:hypothetical protein
MPKTAHDYAYANKNLHAGHNSNLDTSNHDNSDSHLTV